MKVIGLTKFGDPGVLSVLELPEPHAGEGEVRVRVRAAGVNPVDVMVRDGSLSEWLAGADKPYVPGMDVSGTIDEIGPGVEPDFGLSVGLDVNGLVDNYGPFGGYSEYIVLPAASVVQKPTAASFPEAASFLMNALTARTALDALDLAAGDSLLVTGAAGAFGGYVVQLAALDGIRVIAVGSADDEDLLRSLGATDVLVRGDDLLERLSAIEPDGVDAVADGAVLLGQIQAGVRDGGRIAIVRGWEGDLPGRGVTVHHVDVRSRATDRAAIVELGALVEKGSLAMRVAEVLSAEQAVRAHQMLERGGVRGRIILEF